MQTASAQSSCNWSFPDSLQQLSLQRGAVQLHTLQGSLQRGGFPPPLLAVLGKALLHLHDGPGLAARSSKLGAGGRSAQARCRRPPHCPLGAVVPQSPAAACRGRCCAARRGDCAVAGGGAAGVALGAARGSATAAQCCRGGLVFCSPHPPDFCGGHPCVHLCLHLRVHPAMDLSVHLFLHPSVHFCMHPCVQPCMHPCLHPSVHPCSHPSMHPSVSPSVRLTSILSAFLHASLHASLLASLPSPLCASLPAIPMRILFFTPLCISAFISACIPAYISSSHPQRFQAVQKKAICLLRSFKQFLKHDVSCWLLVCLQQSTSICCAAMNSREQTLKQNTEISSGMAQMWELQEETEVHPVQELDLTTHEIKCRRGIAVIILLCQSAASHSVTFWTVTCCFVCKTQGLHTVTKPSGTAAVCSARAWLACMGSQCLCTSGACSSLC